MRHTNIPQWQQRSSILRQVGHDDAVSPNSPTQSTNMLSSLKATLRRKSSSRSNASRTSTDEPEHEPRFPAPTVHAPAELAATAMLHPERNGLSNPSPATRRPNRPGMNAFTVPSNEPPPAYTASPTAVSGPTLGPSPAYSPSASRPTTSTSSHPTTAEDRYSFLSAFDTIILIDDSGSMAGRSWRETSLALSSLLPTVVSHDSDGIDIFFLNHLSSDPGCPRTGIAPGGYRNVTTVAEVERIFRTVRPGGGTPTGTRCRAILKPYLSYLEEMNRHDKIDDVKPLNILAITDGVPSDDVETVLLVAAKKLDALDAAPHQVGVQFFQVGNEEGAAEALKELDDGLGDLVQGGVRDMVDTCTWMGGVRSEEGGEGPKLTADGILKVVLGAVVKRLDRRRCSQEQAR